MDLFGKLRQLPPALELRSKFGAYRSCCNSQEEIEKLLGQELHELKKTAKECERLWRLLIRCHDSKSPIFNFCYEYSPHDVHGWMISKLPAVGFLQPGKIEQVCSHNPYALSCYS